MEKRVDENFNADLAKALYYASSESTDKKRAINMADSFFSKDDIATGIIIDAACGRETGDDDGLVQYGKEIFYKNIKRYIDHLIHKYFNNFVSTGNRETNTNVTESMESSAFLEVMNSLKKYSSDIAQPTTFCRKYILCGISRYIYEQKDLNRHYSKQINSIKRAENEIRSSGREVTLELLHEYLPKMSISQINNAMGLREILDTMQFIDDDGDDTRGSVEGISCKWGVPESEILRKERDDILYDAINNLPEDQKLVFCTAYQVDPENRTIYGVDNGNGECLKLTEISERLRRHDRIISTERISSLKGRATRSIMNAVLLSGYSGDKQKIRNSFSDLHTETILNEGMVTFLDDGEDENVKMAIEAITEIAI
jgi:RNA polymerase sigma factor (sigma-70 family)